MNDLSHIPHEARVPREISNSAFLGRTVGTSHIPGMAVVSAQDVDLGRVDEVVMDAFNSRVAFVVISFGGFLGMGKKRYAAPWRALLYDNLQRAYVLNLTQDEIAILPDYTSESWPDLTGDIWNRNAHGYYQMTPAWMP